VGKLNQQGVDDLIDIVVGGGLTATLDEALQADPRLTTRYLLTLTEQQRHRLYTMTDAELSEKFIGPIITLLRSDHPEQLRPILVHPEGFTTIISIVIIDYYLLPGQRTVQD
jgi:hypothetical protein